LAVSRSATGLLRLNPMGSVLNYGKGLITLHQNYPPHIGWFGQPGKTRVRGESSRKPWRLLVF